MVSAARRLVTRKVVAFACLAAGGFFAASVFATSLPAAFGLAPITLSTPVTTATVTAPAVTTRVTATTPAVTATAPAVTVSTPVATVSTPAVTVAATTPEAAPSVSVPQSTTPAVPPAPVTTSGPPASPVTTAVETSDQGGRAPPVMSHAHSVGANPARTTGVSAAAARAASPATAPRAEPAADPVAAAPEGRATPKAFTRRSGQSASLGGLRVRSLPKLGNRLAVQFRFALDRAARISLVLFGPAPHCVVAGRFAVAGHRGANAVRFDGRVRNRLLQPGVYKIAPRLPGGKSVPGWSAVAVRVDRRGARRVAPLPRLDCQATAVRTEPVPSTPLRLGVEGVQFSKGEDAQRSRGSPGGRGPAGPADRQQGVPYLLSERVWAIFAALGTLAAALLLLILYTVQPGYAAQRFRAVRVFDAHRQEVGLLGGIFLAVAAALLFVQHFS
jgi:hypothetical protein